MIRNYIYFLLSLLCVCQYTNVANGHTYDLKFIRNEQEFLKKLENQPPLTTKEKLLGALMLLGASAGIAYTSSYIYTKVFPQNK